MRLTIKKGLLLALMLLSAGLGAALRPTHLLADDLPAVDLQTMVPTAFGDWHEQPGTLMQIIDPQQQQTLERIYTETLSRTYVNSQGYRVMLSVAYGKNQNKGLELHSPEVCYPAQGFTLADRQKTTLAIHGQPIPSTRIQTTMGQRFEPVTFWTAIGDTVTSSTLQKRGVEFHYALRGRIPDGFLVRVSSIDRDTDKAYAMQAQFADAMVAAMRPEHRHRFVGDALQQ